MRARLLAAASALSLLFTAAPSARANGRFPASNHISFAAHDPNVVLLRVTFGLLVSRDRGKTFHWICEQSIGFSGTEDPMYTMTPSGAFLGTTFQGLTASRDDGCGWSFADGDLKGRVFVDLAADPSNQARVVVLASTHDREDDAGSSLFASQIWETQDEGRTFQRLGGELDPTLFPYTLDLVKSDPNRVYVSAVRSNADGSRKAVLLASTNRGGTWTEEAVALEPDEGSLFIAGVDPTNADRVYLRTSSDDDKPTRLLVRELTTGGSSCRTIYSGKGPLLGFALSPDGSRVYVGGPKDGLFAASSADFIFSEKSKIEVQCLAANRDGLWVCSNERFNFIAALSGDEGATFDTRIRFCDLQGPPNACGPSTPTGQQCGPLWLEQKSRLGCTNAPTNMQDASTDGSTPTKPPVYEPGGGCSTSPVPPWSILVTAGAATLALLRRRARRS
jgi:uncharacterized protein (TIGR03382 family)